MAFTSNKQTFYLKSLWIFIFIFFCQNQTFADDSSGSPGNFLRMGIGRRALAMGKAFVAVADDPTANYWNPAALAYYDRIGFEAMYFQMPFDRTFHFIGTSIPLGNLGSAGLSWIGLKINNIEARTSNTMQPDYYFSDSENALLFSYGKKISSLFAFGINIKWIHHSLADKRASGFGFDSAILIKPMDKLKVGIVFYDANTQLKWLNGYTDYFPQMLRFGLSYRVNSFFNISSGIEKISGTKITTNIGAEIRTGKKIDLQLGLNQGKISTGVSFKFPTSGLDFIFGYSFKTDNLNEQFVHIMSINISSTRKTRKNNAPVLMRKIVPSTNISSPVNPDPKYKKTIKINTSILNVRQGPGTKNRIIGNVKIGQIFKIHNEEQGWVKIMYKPYQYGWINNHYIVEIN